MEFFTFDHTDYYNSTTPMIILAKTGSCDDNSYWLGDHTWHDEEITLDMMKWSHLTCDDYCGDQLKN